MNTVSQFDENRIDEALAFVNDPRFIGYFEQCIKSYYPMFSMSTKEILGMLSIALNCLFPVMTILLYRSRLVRDAGSAKEGTDLVSAEIMDVRYALLDALEAIEDFTQRFENILPVFDFRLFNEQFRKYYQPWADEFRETNPEVAVPDMNSEAFAEYALNKAAEDALEEIIAYKEAQDEATTADSSLDKDGRLNDKQVKILKLRRATSGLF